MMTSLLPGEAPLSLNEARSWLRLGASVDDAVVAGLIRAASNICESFVGQWLIVRAAEEIVPAKAGEIRLAIRPVAGIDAVTLIAPDGSESAVAEPGRRLRIGPDGTGWLSVDGAEGADSAARLRIGYRAGMSADGNGIPEAIRHGLLRMMQHLHAARDGESGAPPAVIAALWQPWRRVALGGAR